MLKSCSNLILTSAFLLGLTACSSQPISKVELLTGAYYWQRTETSSAIYQRGPKAQQMLNRDISRCVTEIRELERLGAIRHVTPGEYNGSAGSDGLTEWDTPERDGYLRAEHLEYHDFETCMMAKGWERIENATYDVSEESREDYIQAITGERYGTRMGDPSSSESSY